MKDRTKTTKSAGSLEEAVDYAFNREKTEETIFEDAMGCTCENAYADMVKTKERFHKKGGVQGYHLVQSFAKGEVSPELAHLIGQELAEQLLKGQFEVVIDVYKRQLQYGGAYYVCGTGRQTLVKDKTANDNYYLLTLAALAQEIRKRKGERTAKVVLAAGLPLAGFGREKQKFKEYLFRKEQPVRFFYEGERYEIQIEDVKLFPQGYSALALSLIHI